MSCLFTPRAEQDIRDIWRWIAAENERAADAMLSAFFDRLELASRHPLMGVKRPDLGDIARILVVGDYVIIYEPHDEHLLVIAIIHGARDLRNGPQMPLPTLE